MFTAAIIIHLVVSIIIIVAVLFQVGKGASIGSTFGGGSSSQTVFGSSGGATFLGKITTACAAIFMVTSLFLTYSSSVQRESSIMGDLPEVGVEKTAEPGAAEGLPAAPGEQAPLPEPEVLVDTPADEAGPAMTAPAEEAEEPAPAADTPEGAEGTK